jgi:AcrR family transcriptional regulator
MLARKGYILYKLIEHSFNTLAPVGVEGLDRSGTQSLDIQGRQKGWIPIAPRSDQDNERIREARREQILEGALKVFARKGLAAARVAEIAAEAGISQGLVYHYFGGKDDIFTAILERSLQGTVWVTGAARERPGTPWDRLAWLFETMVHGGRASPEHLLIAVQASTTEAVPDGTRELMERYGIQIMEDVVALVQDGQAAKQVVDGDARMLAMALLACVQGLALSAVTGSEDPAILPDPNLILRMLRA